jgi:hypothetical protein
MLLLLIFMVETVIRRSDDIYRDIVTPGIIPDIPHPSIL